MAVAAVSAKPLIGVTSSLGRGRYMWWFHCICLRLIGARPVRLVAPFDRAQMEGFDGFIIGGGDDISAELYKGDVTLNMRIDPERDQMELQLLERVVSQEIPVLGVCRGAQILNVYRGGSLHQDMYASFANVPRLRTPLARKTVRVLPGTRLAGVIQDEHIKVNCLHHQAVDRLGDGMKVAARDEYGVVQAIEDPAARFQIGVQWHPEFLIHRRSQRRLFQAFVSAARSCSQAG